MKDKGVTNTSELQPVVKKSKQDGITRLNVVKSTTKNERQIPSSIIVNFIANNLNEKTGPPIELSMSSTQKQLELLVNGLLNQSEDGTSLPYAFYVADTEVEGSLLETVEKLKENGSIINFEETLTITYQPLSVFRVRPVTRCSETMSGHTEAVLHVSYSPDGKKLASGGGDLTVRFWNISTCMPIHTCIGHKHHVLCTGWTADGRHFISADRSGEIHVWNPNNGEPVGQAFRGHKKWVTSLTFEPFHLNPSCRRFASSSKDHTIKVWDISTGQCQTTISGHTDSVENIRWGGNGLIYSCSRDRTIKVWEIDGHGLNQQKLLRTLTGHAHRINSLALNCDYVLRTGPHEFGKELIINKEKDESKQLEELKEIALNRYHTFVGSVGEVLVSGSDDFTLFMWRPSHDKQPVTRMTGHQNLINHIAFSPDGRYLASASFDKKVKLWCGLTGKFLMTWHGHVGSVYQVSWSADSHYLSSASMDSTVKVWSIKDTKKSLHTLSGHADEVYTLDWSPDGTQLASGSKDRTIKIWHH